MKKTKVFAAYLPQFHTTEYNDKFWGKGFTDWVNVKKAVPQYDGHIQPKIPLNNNYYDLSSAEAIEWQAKLAKKYGVSGFNIYHYWFKNGQQALEKPAELILSNKQIDISYFFSWDNCSWVRSWGKDAGNAWAPISDKGKLGSSMLFEQDYGTEIQWKEHFDYLLQFFNDERYYKINGCPVFTFMTSLDQERLVRMTEYWKKLAKENGFPGLYLISAKDAFRNKHLMDNQFRYQPAAASWSKRMSLEGRIKRYFGITIKSKGPVKYFYNYDKVWKNILKDAEHNKNNDQILGCFVKFDDTPRRGKQAGIIYGATPKKFEHWFGKFYRFCCETNREFVLLTAWNEWGEGAYLEPDEEDGYAYLEAVRKVVGDSNAFES